LAAKPSSSAHPDDGAWVAMWNGNAAVPLTSVVWSAMGKLLVTFALVSLAAIIAFAVYIITL